MKDFNNIDEFFVIGELRKDECLVIGEVRGEEFKPLLDIMLAGYNSNLKSSSLESKSTNNLKED